MSDAGRAAEGPAGTGSALSLDERAELGRLRAEASAHPAEPAGPDRRPHTGWRAGALILIVVGCLLAPLSVLPILALLLLALGVYVARGHRRALTGAGLAAGAFLTGPSVTAVRSGGPSRRASAGYGAAASARACGPPCGNLDLCASKGLRICAVSLAALLFVFWGRPTAVVVVVIAILLLVVLGLIELIGSRPPAEPAAAVQL